MVMDKIEDLPKEKGKNSSETIDQNKVAIPRAVPALQTPARRRVERACQECRERKIRCGGQKPSCEQCSAFGVGCVYPSSRREKQEVRARQLEKQNEQFKSLLEKLAGRADSIAEDINQTLGTTTEKKRRRVSGSRRRGSSSSLSSVGSLDAIDVVDEDINRNEESRATGFVGKNSEVSWLQSLDVEAERVNRPDQKRPRRHSSSVGNSNYIASKAYHTGERPMLQPDQLNQYDLPPKHAADAYYDAYFHSVDAYFPIIRKSLFTAQYDRYYAEPFLKPGSKWLAVLNMIFAIASRYLAFLGEEIPGGSEHEIFFFRAKMLSANENIVYGHPDLQQVQIEILLAFYFLALSQVNRAWKMMSIASASAISLGINMRSVDDSTDNASKESRSRLWCSLLMVERSLTTITGRPSTLDQSFSVHAPLPFPESTFSQYPASSFLSNDSEREKIGSWTIFENEAQTRMRTERLKTLQIDQALFFHYQVDLSLISSAITNRIYGVHALQEGWDQVEGAIKLYARKLDRWLTTIHDQYAFVDDSGEPLGSISSREQVGLALYFYSTRILLHRPCLSRPGLRERSGIRFPRSRFGNDTAVVCIRSALCLLHVFPDEPSTNWFYQISPWWTTLHFMMQATVVLLIHLAVGAAPIRPEHGPGGSFGPARSFNPLGPILASCKKVLRWLYHMAGVDLSCKRGFEICHRLLYRIASPKGLDLEGVPSPSSLKQDPPNDPLLPAIEHTPLSELDSTGDHPTTSTRDLAMGGDSSDLFPLSLLAGSDMRWFLSMAELDQSSNNPMPDGDSPDDDPPGTV